MTSSPDVIKPEKDAREYRVLDKGKAKILLVHDIDTKFDAMSISFAAGSMSTPEGKIGLPHLLEHIMFQGSKESTENFQKIVANANGTTNAYTDAEKTVYMFKCHGDSFTKIATEFTELFKNPKFNEAQFEKEKTAVNNEFVKDKEIDGWRSFAVVQDLIKESGHKFSIPGCGNSESLESVKIEDLIQFRKKFYSVVPVYAVMYSALSLVDLEALAGVIFKGDFFGASPTVFSPPSNTKPFDNLDGKWINVNSMMHREILEVNFPMDSLYYQLNYADLEPFSMLLKTSISGKLFEHGWMNDVSCGLSQNLTFVSVFAATVDLTNEGKRHVKDIAQLVKDFFRGLLAYLNDAENSERFRKIAAVFLQTDFQMTEKSDVFDSVTALVNQMDRNHQNLAHVLPGALWKDAVIGPAVPATDLFADQCFVLQSSPEELTGSVKTEPVFNTLYTVTDFFDQNPPLPTDVTDLTDLTATFERCLSEIEKPVLALAENKNWDVVYNHPAVSVDRRVDGKLLDAYECPAKIDPNRVACGIKLSQLSGGELDRGLALKRFAARGVIAALVGKKLATMNSRMGWCMESIGYAPRATGVTVVLEGFHQNLPTLVQTMAENLKPILRGFENPGEEWITSNLLATQQQLVDQIKSKGQCQPYEQCLENLAQMHQELAYSDEEVIKAIKDANISSSKGVFSADEVFYVETLIAGDYDANAVKVVCDAVKEFSADENLFVDPMPYSERNVFIQPPFAIFQKSTAQNNENVALTKVYCLGVWTWLSEISLSLFFDVFAQPFFDELRTEQQLGYVVFAKPMNLNGVLFLELVVQSSSADPHRLKTSTETFTEGFCKKIEKGEFKDLLSAHLTQTIDRLSQKKQSLSQVFIETFGELQSQRYAFDKDERKIEWLESVKENVVDLMKTFVKRETGVWKDYMDTFVTKEEFDSSKDSVAGSYRMGTWYENKYPFLGASVASFESLSQSKPEGVLVWPSQREIYQATMGARLVKAHTENGGMGGCVDGV